MNQNRYDKNEKLEKLEQEFADCVMSNKLLDRENDRLLEQLKEHKYRVSVLEAEVKGLEQKNENTEEFYKLQLHDVEIKIKFLEKQNRKVFNDNEKLKQENKELKNNYDYVWKENERVLNRCTSQCEQLEEYQKFGLDKDLENLRKLK